jgi:hypothetical protein
MLKKLLLILSLAIGGTISIQAQTSCSCNLNGVCSASQSCSSGYQAVCTCQPSGCSSECQKSDEPIIERPDNNTLIRSIKDAGPSNIGEVLTKALGKRIVFEPTAKNFSFDYPESKSNTGSHWDILEFLAGKGKLTINGLKIEVWKGMRDSMLNDAEFNICFENAPVRMILNHVSFISGKHFSIIDGDPKAKISGPLQGNMNELIEKLGKLGKVVIVEN